MYKPTEREFGHVSRKALSWLVCCAALYLPEPGMLTMESIATVPSWQDRQVSELTPGWVGAWPEVSGML